MLLALFCPEGFQFCTEGMPAQVSLYVRFTKHRALPAGTVRLARRGVYCASCHTRADFCWSGLDPQSLPVFCAYAPRTRDIACVRLNALERPSALSV